MRFNMKIGIYRSVAVIKNRRGGSPCPPEYNRSEATRNTARCGHLALLWVRTRQGTVPLTVYK